MCVCGFNSFAICIKSTGILGQTSYIVGSGTNEDAENRD